MRWEMKKSWKSSICSKESHLIMTLEPKLQIILEAFAAVGVIVTISANNRKRLDVSTKHVLFSTVRQTSLVFWSKTVWVRSCPQSIWNLITTLYLDGSTNSKLETLNQMTMNLVVTTAMLKWLTTISIACSTSESYMIGAKRRKRSLDALSK